MKSLTILLGAGLALVPSIRYLTDLRYRVDPSLENSVCRSLLCFDELPLESAQRLAGGNEHEKKLALDNFREALRRNVASPYRWCDLGDALLAAGQIEEARYCFTRATQLGPQSPPVFWRTSQFYTQINDLNRSQEYLGKMVELVPSYEELVFGIYVSNPAGPVAAFDNGIPHQSPIAQDYFQYLLRNNAAVADIEKAWAWLQNHSLDTIELAGDYVDFLSSKHEYAMAAEAWKRNAGSRDAAFLNPNLVFNGSFETEPLPTGLDWRFGPVSNVQMNRDSMVAFTGGSSLQIQFNGEENTDFHALTQNVVVPPGSYHFKAWLRTAGFTTDQEIGFRLIDSSGRTNFEAIKPTGNHDWMPVDFDVTTNLSTRLLRIEVVRKPSWKFDNKIKGSIWIDGVSLVRS